MDKILVFDSSEADRQELARFISARLDAMRMKPAEFLFFKPEDVFTKLMPEEVLVAFFTLTNMNGLEAARHFSKLREKVSLVVISNSDEYGIEVLNFGNLHYLLKPYLENELDMALTKCVKGNIRKQYM